MKQQYVPWSWVALSCALSCASSVRPQDDVPEAGVAMDVMRSDVRVPDVRFPDVHEGDVWVSDAPDVQTTRSCASRSECAPGEDCVGPAGCAVPWTCQPFGACTDDEAPFCGCDGQTFFASSTCPGRVHLYRGACEQPACVIPGIELLRLSSAAFTDQALVFSAYGDGQGCGCQPRLQGDNPFALQACDCCLPCGCVDPGYLANHVGGAQTEGPHWVEVNGTRVSQWVFAPGQGNAPIPNAVRAVAMDAPVPFRVTGPRVDWLQVSLKSRRCCPLFAMREQRQGNVFEMTLTEFENPAIDCDCTGEERDFVAWHGFSGLAPGSYTVRVQALQVQFVVP